MTRLRGFAPLLLLATALIGCGEDTSDEGLVARAGSHVWTADAAAALLAEDTDLPADPNVVRSLAELWIDYTLLAAAAEVDTAMAHVDVSPLVRDLVREQLLLALRDSVIPLDTLRAEEVRERYVLEAPNSLVRARQIALSWPQNATRAQRDSVRQVVSDLRTRIVGGEDFGALASEFSQDPSSSAQGGALPIFGRGQMLPELERAAFALEAGQLSDLVETPYGVHLMRVDERMMPTVERFQYDLIARRVAHAESLYVAGLEDAVSPTIEDGALDRLRELAANPRTELDDRELNRALLKYRGGAVTEGEALWHLQTQTTGMRNGIAATQDDSTLEDVLRGLAHQELLMFEASRRGWEVPVARQQEMADTIRVGLASSARLMGLSPIVSELDQVQGEAVDEAVRTLLRDVLSGARREIVPMGAMSYVLRNQFGGRVIEGGLDEVVARVEAIRQGGTAGSGAAEPGSD